MMTSSEDRVRANTPAHVNQCIDREMACRIRQLAKAGPAAISRRLSELDEEWDFERYVETVAPSLSLGGMTLGFLRGRKWFLVPLVVQGFLLQHAIQGWCPPVEILRRLGVRTSGEINAERHALKALRGDYHDADAPREGAADRALEAARQ